MKRIKYPVTINFTKGRPQNNAQAKILWGVFHTTADSPSSTVYDIRNWWENPLARSSAHYIIGSDGTELQAVEEYDTAWACANWPVNLQSISLEHQDHGKSDDAIRTDALYETSAQRVADIHRRYEVPIKLVEADVNHIPLEPGWLKHKQVSTQGTNCPGGLDVERIIRRAIEIINEPGPEAIT
jgi:hypothetical protein